MHCCVPQVTDGWFLYPRIDHGDYCTRGGQASSTVHNPGGGNVSERIAICRICEL